MSSRLTYLILLLGVTATIVGWLDGRREDRGLADRLGRLERQAMLSRVQLEEMRVEIDSAAGAHGWLEARRRGGR